MTDHELDLTKRMFAQFQKDFEAAKEEIERRKPDFSSGMVIAGAWSRACELGQARAKAVRDALHKEGLEYKV